MPLPSVGKFVSWCGRLLIRDKDKKIRGQIIVPLRRNCIVFGHSSLFASGRRARAASSADRHVEGRCGRKRVLYPVVQMLVIWMWAQRPAAARADHGELRKRAVRI